MLRTRHLQSIMLTITLVVLSVLIPRAQAHGLQADPSSATASGNPTLAETCGESMEVALILDASGSVAGYGAVEDIRGVGLALATGLVDRNVSLTVVEYATFSDTPIESIALTSANVESVFRPYFDGTGSPSYYDGRVGRYTNWDDGFRAATHLTTNPDLVILISDGNPNTVGDRSTAVNGNASTAVAASAASQMTSELKANGSHVIGMGLAGLNSDSGADLLQQISGDRDLESDGLAEGDFFVGDFADLNELVGSLTSDFCKGTLLVKSVIDRDGDLSTTDDQVPAVGWPIEVARTNGEVGLSADVTEAGGSVTLTPRWDENGVANFKLMLAQPPLPGHYVASSNCTGAKNTGQPVANFRHSGLVITQNNLAECTFINVVSPPALGFDLQTASIEDVDGSGTNSPGDIVHYLAIARNDGGQRLTNVKVKSDFIEWASCSKSQGTGLAINRRFVCRGTYLITAADAGTDIVHAASAESTQTEDLLDREVTSVHLTSVEVGSLVDPRGELTVTADFDRLDDRDDSRDPSPGDEVWFRFTATNTGNIVLTGVDFTPDGVQDISCSPVTDTLAVGDSIVCEGKRPILGSDIGQSVFAPAMATSAEGPAASDTAFADVGIPRGTLTKVLVRNDDLDRNDRITVGDVLHYEIRIANTGTANLSNVTLEDSRVTPRCDGWTDRHISAGEMVVCTAAIEVREDHAGTTLTNVASVMSNQLDELADTASIDIPFAAVCQTNSVLFDETVALLGRSDRSVTSEASIENGSYELRLVGADALHKADYQTTQTNEAFFVEFLDADGRVIAVSSSGDDIPDADRWTKSVLIGSTDLDREVTAVRARHVGTNNVNSVAAICVEFDRM